MNIMVHSGSVKAQEGQNYGDLLKMLRGDADLARKCGVENILNDVLAVTADGVEYDLSAPMDHPKEVRFLTARDEEGLFILRHSTAHLMAQALMRLRPGTKPSIGPVIRDGFYYDFEIPGEFGDSDLPALEKEMEKIAKEAHPILREMWTKQEALSFFKKENEAYKVEILEELIKGDDNVSLYRQGEFLDLCRGVHVPNTAKLKVFKLMTVAGAYWRGDEKRQMLTRIYGTAWASKDDLALYLHNIEEAKKRDHRKLGKELKLFGFHEEGPGLAFWYPKGTILKQELLSYMREEITKRDYLEIETPTILKTSLWETSGHMNNYKENMFFTSTKEDEAFAIKPMNCPGGILWYLHEPHSYRELPIRLAEFGLVHRYEKSGQLNGLLRVRAFMQDDAHTFMTPEQTEDEIFATMELVDAAYSTFGFEYQIEFSTRPEKSIGTDADWEKSQGALKGALDRFGKKYSINEGDGAFYGPKIDYHLKDALGRTHQCATIQLDMNLPLRFNMTYKGSDGQDHPVVMIHRTIYGSLERFMGVLIEHFAGKFPLWLAPTQVKILSVSDKFIAYAQEVKHKLQASGIRTEIDKSSETLGYKIRNAAKEKVPYSIVIGEKEEQSKTIAPRHRDKGEEPAVSVEEFAQGLQQNITKRALEF